jgi:hypothetical protein
VVVREVRLHVFGRGSNAAEVAPPERDARDGERAERPRGRRSISSVSAIVLARAQPPP